MRILTSYEEAFTEGKKALDSRDEVIHTESDYGLEKFPEQVYGPWKQTEQALSNTLKYVFEKLHHNCYLLCVVDEKPNIFKLENKTTSPSFERRINKTLRRKQIKSRVKTWRVMQCVLKPFKIGTTADEWETYFGNLHIQLPDGVYLFSFTDAVILRKDGKEPWPLVTGDKELDPKYSFTEFIPIFGYSGQEGYWDIPFPNYDDVFANTLGPTQEIWESKQPKAVFRGTSTGCGITSETNQRLKLATMRSDELDVGITKYTTNLKFDPIEQLGVPEKVAPIVDFKSLETQGNYKYIIHVDGNVVAYRLLKSMLTRSLILRVKSDYIHWIDHLIQPGEHYIEVKSDLSDLQTKLEWCKNNDAKCKEIAHNGYIFAKHVLNKYYIEESISKLLWKVA